MNTTLTRAIKYITDMESTSQDMFNALQAIMYDADINSMLTSTKKELFAKAEDSITAYLQAQGFN